MASNFLFDDILRKEWEESATGNMLYDSLTFKNYLKVAPGGSIPIKSSDVSAPLSEIKKRDGNPTTRSALNPPFISYENSSNKK